MYMYNVNKVDTQYMYMYTEHVLYINTVLYVATCMHLEVVVLSKIYMYMNTVLHVYVA